MANSLSLGVAPSFADAASSRSSANIALQFLARGLFLILFGGLSLALFSPQLAYAETIPATVSNATPYKWGWDPAWGAPWGNSSSCSGFSFSTSDPYGCAPMAEICHPNRGQEGYSPFYGGDQCGTYTSTGRYAGAGGKVCPVSGQSPDENGLCGATYSCPSSGGWTLSSDKLSCSRPDCPAGYTRDPNTGACLGPCPADQVRNLSTIQCEVVCDAPLIRTGANVCDCPDPLILIDGNTCIGRDGKDRGESCQQSASD